MAATPGTTPAKTMIPVRLNLLVKIDPAKWTAPAATAGDAPAYDQDKTAQALTALYGAGPRRGDGRAARTQGPGRERPRHCADPGAGLHAAGRP